MIYKATDFHNRVSDSRISRQSNPNFPTPFVQAAQVRKTSFMHSEEGQGQAAAIYSPETHHSCTVHAGTYVQQVQCLPHMHPAYVLYCYDQYIDNS